MKTFHEIYFAEAARMTGVESGSVALVVTSPPYPMIEMWDGIFSSQDGSIAGNMAEGKGFAAFEKMHRLLDPVWEEVYRVLMPGGIACINIGDAVRTLQGNFALYPSHVRILSHLISLGFSPLPEILWRKQTNAPNKFMGSGMMPPGAYVTLEHEHLLLVRKGEKREFKTEEEKQNRRASAFFWEERNLWFSDIWMDIKGTRQELKDKDLRLRSAAFPFELPYRLISMFSVKGDTVLDPFAGTGTTMAAAMAAGRSSIGFEIETGFLPAIRSRVDTILPNATARIRDRLTSHEFFLREKAAKSGSFKHQNEPYGFPVVTRQETGLLLNSLTGARSLSETSFETTYDDSPQADFSGRWEEYFTSVHPRNS